MTTEFKKKILLQDFQKGFSVLDATLHQVEKFGEKGYCSRTCQRWYKIFRENFHLAEKQAASYRMKNDTLNESTKKSKNVTKQKRAPPKDVQVDVMTFKQKQQKNLSLKVKENGRPIPPLGGVSLRKDAPKPNIIKKRFITPMIKNSAVQKVQIEVMSKKDQVKPNITTKRSVKPVLKITTVSPIRPSSVKKLFPMGAINISNLKADLILSPNTTKRIPLLKTLRERHNIEKGRRLTRTTGQEFQNISPKVFKNTTRKVSKPTVTPLNANKRLTEPHSTPLSSSKGVIYLNPQEVFKPSFDHKIQLNRPRPGSNLPKIPKPILEKVVPIKSLQKIRIDSDSEDDIVFPEDISLPQPKIKLVTKTFTTYWDMETDKPIQLNPTEGNTVPTSTVIEID